MQANTHLNVNIAVSQAVLKASQEGEAHSLSQVLQDALNARKGGLFPASQGEMDLQ